MPVIVEPSGIASFCPSVALIIARKSAARLQGTDVEQSSSEGGNDVQTPGKRRTADVGADLAGQLSLKRLKINKNNFTGLEQQGRQTMICCRSAPQEPARSHCADCVVQHQPLQTSSKRCRTELVVIPWHKPASALLQPCIRRRQWVQA